MSDNTRILAVSELGMHDEIAAEIVAADSGKSFVTETSWLKAIDRIRDEAFDAVMVDSVFQSGNDVGDNYEPTRLIIDAAKQEGISRILVATPLVPLQDRFPSDVPVIDILSTDTRDLTDRILKALNL